MMSSNREIRNKSRIRTSDGLNRAIHGELAALERDLVTNLLNLYAIIRQFDMPVEYFKNNPDIRYQVQSHIRRNVQDSYLIGIDVVGTQLKRRVSAFELFISGTDINEIKSISQAMFDRYWYTTQKLLTRETATSEKDNVKIEKRKFDIESAYQSLSSYAVYQGYNRAVSSKLTHAFPTTTQQAEQQTGLTGAFSLKKIFKGSFEKFRTKITDVFGDLLGLKKLQEQIKPKLMFVTKGDSKVCDTTTFPFICTSLNGKEFEADDPQKPEMPMHDWCRCLLVPAIESEGILG